MAAKLRLIQKPAAAVPDQLIEKALAYFVEAELSEFASHLETARVMWRKHPELVEAPEFPEPLRNAYINTYECEPDDMDCIEGLALAPDLRERLLPQAIDTARFWVLRDQGATVFGPASPIP